MEYRTGIPREEGRRQIIRGRYQKVAVDCWFTSTGKTIPRMIKYEDCEGCVRTLREIQLLRNDKCCQAGMPVFRYDCLAAVNGREQRFTLLYHPGKNIWDMVLPE